MSVLVDELLDSYLSDERARRISQRFLPSREAIVEILEAVLDLMYPGYFGRSDLNRDNLTAHVAHAVSCACAENRARDGALSVLRPRAGHHARRGERLRTARQGTDPSVPESPAGNPWLLIRDIQAAFDGDPAATNLDEVVLAYPGVLAVSVYRIAHALYDLGVPMMARIMTEWRTPKPAPTFIRVRASALHSLSITPPAS